MKRHPAFPISAAVLLTLFWWFHAGQAHADARQTLELKMGESKIVTTPFPFKRVSVAVPEVADIVVLSPKEAYVYGKSVGYTSMVLWEAGYEKTMLDVVVVLDLTALKEKIQELYPDQQIAVHGTETGIVLSGTVSGPEIVEQVIRLAEAYLPKEGDEEKKAQTMGTGKSGSAVRITNLLKVSGLQQVMLEVKFAEVSRESGRDWQAAVGLNKLNRWGKDWNNFRGNLGTSPLGVPQFPEVEKLDGGTDPITGAQLPSTLSLLHDAGALAQSAGTLLMNFAGNPANVFLDIDNFTAALEFLEGESLARILAEPRLVTQSGQEASFLAGGEFPVPVADGLQRVTITFKEFGVSLTFTPYVLSDGKISLHVTPSVSEIAGSAAIPAGIEGASFIVPNLSTRRLSTTVELRDGQTLALAGLLQDSMRETVKKVPGLGDLPILGALFRSSSYLQNKTDLLIAVTPRLVKPVSEESINFPGGDWQPPSRTEFYLEGKLEGERTAAGLEGGLEGQFGHEPLR